LSKDNPDLRQPSSRRNRKGWWPAGLARRLPASLRGVRRASTESCTLP
jgi:hypothetical protein